MADVTATRSTSTRQQILEVAEAAVLTKGFGSTSIDELITAVGISKSGFFYHFRDKNQLALALIDRYIERDDQIVGDLLRRSRELHDDPLHQLLIGLRLFAALMADLPNGHPGCLAATFAYQERLFDKRVITANRQGVLTWRTRYRKIFDDIVVRYPPKDDVNLDALADMVSTTVEGGIILSKALGEPAILPQQILLLRSYIKLLFLPDAA